MRVLLVSNLYPPYWIGGYEQIAGWVASGLRERGHEVCVLTGRGAAFAEHSEVEPGLDLDLAALCADSRNGGIAFPGDARAAFRRHVFHAGHYRTAKSLIARFRPDLVSFWNPAFITYSPLLAARMAGIPSVAHVSDASSNVFRGVAPPACPPMLRGLARGAVDGLFSLASPARIVVPSEFLKRRLLSEGIGSGRVSVLPWPGGIASRSDEAPRTASVSRRRARIFKTRTRIFKKSARASQPLRLISRPSARTSSRDALARELARFRALIAKELP